MPAYAVPARTAALHGLPPAYIVVGALDLFRDQGLASAQRLLPAGVSAELHVRTGAFHGWDLSAPDSSLIRRFIAECDALLRRALSGPTAGARAGAPRVTPLAREQLRSVGAGVLALRPAGVVPSIDRWQWRLREY